MLESRIVDGFALNCTRASQQMPSTIRGAKIALLDIDLRKAKMMMGVSVQVSDPSKLAAIRDKEADITKQRIMLLISAGVNVILTTQGMDDQAMKYLVENGVLGVRRCKKTDLKHVAKVCGGEVLLSFADMEGGESIPPGAIGSADEVSEEKVGDGELIFIKGCASTRAQTILLRGANDFMLDEVERSLHDALCVVKRTLESKTVVPGGGAVEAALSVYLESLADTVATREQLAIACFAQSMLIIPKTLAVNGAFDATDLVAQLRAHHTAAQKKGLASSKYMGLNLEVGAVQDNVQAGVLEPAMSKIKMIQFATEAAVHILRIDVSIKMNPKEDPKNPMRDEY
jgi:T-complex protein 1 subunit alpha